MHPGGHHQINGGLRRRFARQIAAERRDGRVAAGRELSRLGQALRADDPGDHGMAQRRPVDGVAALPFRQAEAAARRQPAGLLPQDAVGLIAGGEIALSKASIPEEGGSAGDERARAVIGSGNA